MALLYVLELRDDKWFIGSTNMIVGLLEWHKEGAGPAWTREYRPYKITRTFPNSGFDAETRLTKQYMQKYGIDNVRGGVYKDFNLPDIVKVKLEMDLFNPDVPCPKCSFLGHYEGNCPITFRK